LQRDGMVRQQREAGQRRQHTWHGCTQIGARSPHGTTMTTTHEDQRAGKHPQTQKTDGDQAATTHVVFSRAVASRGRRASTEKQSPIQNPSSTLESSHIFPHWSISTAARRAAWTHATSSTAPGCSYTCAARIRLGCVPVAARVSRHTQGIHTPGAAHNAQSRGRSGLSPGSMCRCEARSVSPGAASPRPGLERLAIAYLVH
jgi:hypothetical protein